MLIKFSFECEEAYSRFLPIIKEIENQLNQLIEKEKYGNIVNEIYIGIILIKTRPGYEKWFKERKLKFKASQILRNQLYQLIELKNILSFDIKFEDDELYHISTLTDFEFMNYFKIKINNSFVKLQKLPRAAANFDYKKFISDVSPLLKGL